jgi:Protein of unknown function (DUF1573)
MKKILAIVFVLTSLTSGFAQEKKMVLDAANDTNKPQFKFEVEEYNFGTIKATGEVSYEFVFTNSGIEPLVITAAQGSCGCTVPVYPKEPITKNQKGKIKVTFNPSGKFGTVEKTVTITSNAVQSPMTLRIKATIEGSPVQAPAPASK